jgi:hypothetical protein
VTGASPEIALETTGALARGHYEDMPIIPRYVFCVIALLLTTIPVVLPVNPGPSGLLNVFSLDQYAQCLSAIFLIAIITDDTNNSRIPSSIKSVLVMFAIMIPLISVVVLFPLFIMEFIGAEIFGASFGIYTILFVTLAVLGLLGLAATVLGIGISEQRPDGLRRPDQTR